MFSDCAVYAANKWMEYGSCGTLQVGRNRYNLGMIGLVTPQDVGDVGVSEDLMRALIDIYGIRFAGFDFAGNRWKEVDYPSDIAAARTVALAGDARP